MTGAGGSDPLAWVRDELGRLDRAGLRRPTRVCRVLPGGRVEVDGRELWNFGGNDYLGLASEGWNRDRQGVGSGDGAPGESRLADARGSISCGATASPAVVGRSPEIAELERTLAEFEGTEDAVVFPTGYAANLGTVAALTGPGDAVFVERDCHACLVDGAKLGGGRLRVWRRDGGGILKLHRRLAEASGYRRRWIVTEAVFGMDGDFQSVGWAQHAAERFDALVIADYAHATGIPAVARPGHHPRTIATGTLSKAVGTLGGFAAASRPVCDLLRHNAKSYIFSTALPPAAAAAALRNVRRLESKQAEAHQLCLRGKILWARLRAAGLDLPSGGRSLILAVLLGDPADAVRASERLAEEGFFVPAIRPPTVPRGTSRLRISLSLAHPPEVIGALGDTLIRLLKGSA